MKNKEKEFPRKLLPKSLTSIQGFDEITGGGLPKGRPTLVCGGPGCGKTLFAMEFIVRGAMIYNEPGVFISFEETEKELTANVASLGFDLDKLVRQKKIWLEHIHVERGEIEQSGEYDLKGLFVRIHHAIENIGANRKCVGLHIRVTDKINENPSRWEIHPREMEQVEKRTVYAIKTSLRKNHLNRVYLATDCFKARMAWKNKLESLGVTVLLNPYVVYDDKQFRQTSTEDFLIDLFSLSRCRQIVGSIDSGVPWTASKIGGLDENEIIWGRYATSQRLIVRELRKKSKIVNLLISGVKRLKTTIVKS